MKNTIILLILLLYLKVFSQTPDSLWSQDDLSNATVLLFQQLSDSTNFIGSGTIISNGLRYFLLTAQHVAIEMRTDSKIIFHSTGDKPEIIDLIELAKNHSLRWTSHLIADISLVELIPSDDNIKQRFDDWSFPINQIHFGKELPSKEADLTFLGFPVIDLKMEHFSPLIFTAYLASGLITQYRYDIKKTMCNFFYLNEPSIQGCSGAGVYFSVKKGMFFGNNRTIFIGIVHGTKGDNTGGKLAAITPSYYILELLKKLYAL